METASNILMGILIYYLIYIRQQGLITIGDFVLILMISISAIDAAWNLSRDFLDFSEKLGRCFQHSNTYYPMKSKMRKMLCLLQ